MPSQFPPYSGLAAELEIPSSARLIQHSRRTTSIMILILLLATALRAHNLDRASLWSDETRSALVALNQPMHIIGTAGADVHSPAFYLVEHYWIQGLGQSDYSIRLLSVFASLVTVAITFALSKRLLGADSGSMAALLVAVSEFHLRLAQEARPYALLSLLTSASFLTMSELVRHTTAKAAAKYLLATVPLIYIHPYGVLIVAAQNFFVLLQWRTRRSAKGLAAAWISTQCGLLFAFSPWMAQFVSQISRVQRGVLPYYAPPTAQNVIGTLLEFANLSRYLLGLLLLLAFAAFWGKGISKMQSIYAMLGVWLIAPIGLAFAVSWAITPIYDTRGLIGCSPALYILAAHGRKKLRNRYLQAALLVVMLGFCFEALWYYYPNVHKDDWRGAAKIISAQAHQGDTLCVVEYYDDALRFYFSRSDLVVGCAQILGPLADPGKLRTLPARFWFLHQNSAVLDANPREMLRPYYSISKFDLTGLQLSLFERQ